MPCSARCGCKECQNGKPPQVDVESDRKRKAGSITATAPQHTISLRKKDSRKRYNRMSSLSSEEEEEEEVCVCVYGHSCLMLQMRGMLLWRGRGGSKV